MGRRAEIAVLHCVGCNVRFAFWSDFARSSGGKISGWRIKKELEGGKRRGVERRAEIARSNRVSWNILFAF